MTNAFVGPRGRDVARKLLTAAEEVGLDPQVVLTTKGGYLVPVEVVDHLDAQERKASDQEVADSLAAALALKEAQEAQEEQKAAAAKEKAEKEQAEKAAADEAAATEKAEAEKKAPAPKTARAPRARRTTKASDAGEEKD